LVPVCWFSDRADRYTCLFPIFPFSVLIKTISTRGSCRPDYGEERAIAGNSPDFELALKEKKLLRREMIRQREALDSQVMTAAGREITRRLLALDSVRQARRILFYLAIRNEVPTDEMIIRVLQTGKTVLVPLVDPEKNQLRISELSGLDMDFEEGPFGIREPGPDCRKYVDPGNIDCVIVPGVAYGADGGRIGFGKGYYDRLLSGLGSSVPKVAPAYEFQVLPEIPRTAQDVPMDIIVTEKRTIHCDAG